MLQHQFVFFTQFCIQLKNDQHVFSVERSGFEFLFKSLFWGKLLRFGEVDYTDVLYVWDKRWHPDMIAVFNLVYHRKITFLSTEQQDFVQHTMMSHAHGKENISEQAEKTC